MASHVTNACFIEILSSTATKLQSYLLLLLGMANSLIPMRWATSLLPSPGTNQVGRNIAWVLFLLLLSYGWSAHRLLSLPQVLTPTPSQVLYIVMGKTLFQIHHRHPLTIPINCAIFFFCVMWFTDQPVQVIIPADHFIMLVARRYTSSAILLFSICLYESALQALWLFVWYHLVTSLQSTARLFWHYSVRSFNCKVLCCPRKLHLMSFIVLSSVLRTHAPYWGHSSGPYHSFGISCFWHNMHWIIHWAGLWHDRY